MTAEKLQALCSIHLKADNETNARDTPEQFPHVTGLSWTPATNKITLRPEKRSMHTSGMMHKQLQCGRILYRKI